MNLKEISLKLLNPFSWPPINHQSTIMSANESPNDELNQILKRFKDEDLFSLNLESLNENDLLEKYYAVKNLKFNFMEALILGLIKQQSPVDSESRSLFEQYDQLMSDILMRIKDDKRLVNYELNVAKSTNGMLPNGVSNIENSQSKAGPSSTEDESMNVLYYSTEDESLNALCNLTVTNNESDNKTERKSKSEIVLSSDEDTFDVNLIPCEADDSDFDLIDDDSENEQTDYQQIFVNSSHKAKYLKRDYPFSEKLFFTFYNVFGLKSFRKNQLECMNAAMLNEDIFILMPTGSGKSICYQLPAVLNSGITIVISPLRSLIQDQVQKLRMIGVKAETMCNDIRQSSEKEIYDDLRKDQPTLKLLYVTPEKISQSKRLVKIMESLYEKRLISSFVIDEAHCVSDYGHDFRPDYKRLSELREKYTDVPLMALTATATPRVGCDIMKQLKMTNPVCFIQSFNRPNLRFEVREKSKETLNEIADLIKNKFKRKSGIIYCLSRYESEQVAEYLTQKGVRTMPYHAGLTDKDRFQIQENWLKDRFQVVSATIAFGMGIDKPDVRFVIHYSAPKSIEGYYQEAGRAGRDGKLSHCYLYYIYKDIKRLFKLFEEGRGTEGWKVHINNLNSVAYYATNNLECRKMQILRHFGENFNVKECSKQTASCDNCESGRGSRFQFKDYSEEAKLIVSSIQLIYKNANKKFPISHYVDVFKGSQNAKVKAENHQSLPMHGKGKSMDKEVMERFFRKLILEEFIKESAYLIQYDVVVAYLAPTKKGQDLLDGKVRFELPVEDGKIASSGKNKSTKKDDNPTTNKTNDVKEMNLNSFEELCYQSLLDVSNRYVAEKQLKQTTIIPLSSLKEMAIKLPKDKKELMKIAHVTKRWLDDYGANVMQAIENCIELKKNTEQLDKDLSLNTSLIELSGDEMMDDDKPCTSSSVINNDHGHKNKKLRTD